MRDPLSTTGILGDLWCDDVIFSYGFPQLFSSAGDAGRVIGMCIEESENTARFLYVQIDQNAYERFRRGEMSLRDWMDETQPPTWITLWHFTGDEITAEAEARAVLSLSDAELPSRGATLGSLARSD